MAFNRRHGVQSLDWVLGPFPENMSETSSPTDEVLSSHIFLGGACSYRLIAATTRVGTASTSTIPSMAP